ncbi:MAG: hypothetical protein ACFFCS_16235 [Candidatus Hodarchaeota archaeon]
MKEIAFLIPIKQFSKAKSRLTSIFPLESRFEMQEMISLILFRDLMDTLGALKEECENCTIKIIICSSENKIKDWIENLNDSDFIFMDEGVLDLKGTSSNKLDKLDEIIDLMNQRAINELNSHGSILLMNDLPLLSLETLRELINIVQEVDENSARVILSPSVGNGCNMVIRVPPGVMKTNYSGISPSFINNLNMAKSTARDLGIPRDDFIHIYKNLELYLDLDMPEDLISIFPLLQELKPTSRMCNLLEKMKLEIQNLDGEDNRNLNFTFKKS